MNDESTDYAGSASEQTDSESHRDSQGRFTKGCKPGPGRKRLPRSAQYRKAYEDAITPEDLATLVRNTLYRAMNGDHRARAWIGQYYFQDKNRRPPPIARDAANPPSSPDLKASATVLKS